MLRHFHRSLQCKFLVGACPFVVDVAANRVRCTRRSLAYSLFFVLAYTVMYPCSLYRAVVCFEVGEISEARKWNIAITHCTHYAVFVLFQVLSVCRRRRHAALVNAINCICDREVAAHSSSGPQWPPNDYRLRHAANVLYVLAYLGCPVTKLLYLDVPEVQCIGDMVPFFLLFGFLSANMLVVVVHVQDIIAVLCDLIDRHGSNEAHTTRESLAVLDQLYEITGHINRCFGAHFLLIAFDEVNLIAHMLIVNIRQMPSSKQEYGVVYALCLVSTFVVPCVIKNIVQTLVIERFAGKVTQLERLIEGRLRRRQQLMMLVLVQHKCMHHRGGSAINACGLFAINSSTLFQVIYKRHSTRKYYGQNVSLTRRIISRIVHQTVLQTMTKQQFNDQL